MVLSLPIDDIAVDLSHLFHAEAVFVILLVSGLSCEFCTVFDILRLRDYPFGLSFIEESLTSSISVVILKTCNAIKGDIAQQRLFLA